MSVNRNFVTPPFASVTVKDSGVLCPDCKTAKLISRFSCLVAKFYCPDCDTEKYLEDMASKLSDQEFVLLAEIVGNRSSDRV